MKSADQKITVIGTLLVGFFATATPVFAQAKAWSGVCVSDSDSTVATIQGLQCLLANVLSTFLTLVGLAAFIMLIISAFRILLSGGNSQNVEKAQKSITYAIVALVVAVSAFVILNLVAEFTGVETILKFSIPSSDTQWPR